MKYKIATEQVPSDIKEVIGGVERVVAGFIEVPKISYSPDSKADKDGNYSVIITIGLECTDGIGAPFPKQIEVVSNNDQKGSEVDIQRELAIQNFLTQINS